METVSIVIAAYNAEQTIRKCVLSYLSQTYSEVEVIVVDDGSTDSTLSILESLAEDHANLHIISQKNKGVSGARNAGLEEAVGAFVMFADSDDWIEPEAVEALVSEAQKNDVDLVVFDHFASTDSTDIVKRLFPRSFSTSSRRTLDTIQSLILCIMPSTISSQDFDRCFGFGGSAWKFLIKKNLITLNSIKFDTYLDGLLEDGFFMMQVLEVANSIAYVDRPFYHYYVGGASTTHGYHPDYEERCNRAVERFRDFGIQSNKSQLYFQALASREQYLLKMSCEVHYQHEKNPESLFKRLKGFRAFASSEPYSVDIRKLKTQIFSSRLERIQTALLAKGHYRTFYFLRYGKRKIDSRRKDP